MRGRTHSRADYFLTGPESLSQLDQLTIIGRVPGRRLRIQEMPPEEARRELTPVLGPSVADMLLCAWEAALGQPAFVTRTVEEVTGSRSRTFLEWATDHARDF